MADGLTIVIPARTERRLADTVRQCAAGARKTPMEIIVAADGGDPGPLPDIMPNGVSLRILRPPGAEPRGVDAGRDAGSMAATYGTMLFLDAHCDLPPNDWARYLVRWSTQHPADIACCVCVGLDDARPTPHTWNRLPRYYGARIELCGHDGATWRLFCDKWLDDPRLPENIRRGLPQRIPSPLGGAYVFQRARYLALGRPWRGMLGWGGSEVTLALVNELAGGTCWLLPVEIAHYFRSSAPYQTASTVVIHNQLRLLHILPMPDTIREALTVWLLDRNPAFRGPAFGSTLAALRRDGHWPLLRAIASQRGSDCLDRLLEAVA